MMSDMIYSSYTEKCNGNGKKDEKDPANDSVKKGGNSAHNTMEIH